MNVNEYDNKSIRLFTKVYHTEPQADGQLLLPANNNRYGIYISSSLANTQFTLHAYEYIVDLPTIRLSSFYQPFLITYKHIGELIKAPFYVYTTLVQQIPVIEICLPCECRLEILKDMGL